MQKPRWVGSLVCGTLLSYKEQSAKALLVSFLASTFPPCLHGPGFRVRPHLFSLLTVSL